jgi:hypothetical protein
LSAAALCSHSCTAASTACPAANTQLTSAGQHTDEPRRHAVSVQYLCSGA